MNWQRLTASRVHSEVTKGLPSRSPAIHEEKTIGAWSKGIRGWPARSQEGGWSGAQVQILLPKAKVPTVADTLREDDALVPMLARAVSTRRRNFGKPAKIVSWK